jgi:hypothetical protein
MMGDVVTVVVMEVVEMVVVVVVVVVGWIVSRSRSGARISFSTALDWTVLLPSTTD